MTTNRVRVRLVPKHSFEHAPAPSLFSAGLFQTSRAAVPLDPGIALDTERKVLAMNMAAATSPQQRVEVDVPMEHFHATFQAELEEVLLVDPRFPTTRSFMRPKGELTVPDSLKETVDFAYVPTPPHYFSAQPIPPATALYHLRLEDVVTILRAGRCHARGWRGQGIRIAMTDSGFALHPYFERRGYNIRRLTTPSVTQPTLDASGHGTGESANALALAPDCEFVGVKHDDYSALALETALAENPHIVTNSWGFNIDTMSFEQLRAADPNLYNECRDIERIVHDAVSRGIVIIFSAGNGHHAFPGSIPEVISAGGVSVDPQGALSASSYASSFRSALYPGRAVPDICGIVGDATQAPMPGHIMLPVPPLSQLDGENLGPGARGTGWGSFSGTSAAAPQLAGVIALMLSAYPLANRGELTRADIVSLLLASGTDVTSGTTALGDVARPGPDDATGAGLVDAFVACQRVEQLAHSRGRI